MKTQKAQLSIVRIEKPALHQSEAALFEQLALRRLKRIAARHRRSRLKSLLLGLAAAFRSFEKSQEIIAGAVSRKDPRWDPGFEARIRVL